VHIRAVSYRDGVVDLEVVTRDRWTLDPSVSFSRQGGVNTDRIGLKEDNFLGTGLSVGYSRSSNVDRTSNTFNVSHPHAFGPFTNGSYSYADTSDGRTWGRALPARSSPSTRAPPWARRRTTPNATSRST
jgi:outer membrane protein assembly factor BamA